MARSPLVWLSLSLAAIFLLAIAGPAERSLGANVRVVYLHGAWVWAALGGFVAAALAGLSGLLLKRETFHRWSRAAGRAALVFWVTYLPLSIWAMQTNWNGLFLAEPRWRLAVIFAIGGLILQIGISLMEDPIWASAGNLVFAVALFFALRSTENVMHPSSPIFSSDAWRIQAFFVILVGLVLFAEGQLARWLRQLDDRQPERLTAPLLD
jgi:hypothetical protein